MINIEFEVCGKALPLPFSALLVFCLFLTGPSRAGAQGYLGLGFHFTPPVFLEHPRNAYVVATPRPGLGGAISYRREWVLPHRRKWYGEAGLTVQGLWYDQVSFSGDSVNIWSDFPNTHTGFPSVFLGTGHSFPIGNSKNAISVGVEASYLIAQDLDEIGSYSFGISHDPAKDDVFPLFLRLNLAFSRDLTLFRTVPAQLQLYANLSAQDITRGTQFIRDKTDGSYREGEYRVNNSELGLKLFTRLNPETWKRRPDGTPPADARLAAAERQVKFRISLAGQLFAPPPTVYHIPQVDSFSVNGRSFIPVPQYGFVVEFPHRRNDLWSTVAGLGFGHRVSTLVFRADGAFTANGLPAAAERHYQIGYYATAGLGLSRRHALGRLVMAHTLSFTTVVPLGREYEYMGVPQAGSGQVVPPYEDPVLEGWIDYRYGREKVSLGLEYNPELVFNLNSPCFIAVGLVANYSRRDVVASGPFRVTNGRTTYHGAMLQRFSKIGVSLRFGLEQ